MSAVTRLGDMASGHGCWPAHPSIEGSPNVFVNGIPVVRVGDAYQPHTCVSTHGGNLAAGSSSVFVNGKAIGRVGDPVSCGSTVSQGSPNVFAG